MFEDARGLDTAAMQALGLQFNPSVTANDALLIDLEWSQRSGGQARTWAIDRLATFLALYAIAGYFVRTIAEKIARTLHSFALAIPLANTSVDLVHYVEKQRAYTQSYVAPLLQHAYSTHFKIGSPDFAT